MYRRHLCPYSKIFAARVAGFGSLSLNGAPSRVPGNAEIDAGVRRHGEVHNYPAAGGVLLRPGHHGIGAWPLEWVVVSRPDDGRVLELLCEVGIYVCRELDGRRMVACVRGWRVRSCVSDGKPEF